MNRERWTFRMGRSGFCMGIYLSYFLLISLLMLAFSVFSYMNTRETIRENMLSSMSGGQQQSAILLNRMLEDLFYSGNLIYTSNEFRALDPLINERRRENAPDILMYYQTSNAFSYVERAYSTCDLRIFVHDNALFANERELFFPISDISGEDWYAAAMATPGHTLWCYSTLDGKPAIACVRLVIRGELTFAIYSGLTMEHFAALLDSPFAEDGGKTLLFNGVVALSSEGVVRDEAVLASLAGRPSGGSGEMDVAGNRCLYTDTTLGYGGWTMLSVIPERSMYTALRESLVSGTVFVLVCFLLALVLALLIGRIFAGRIRELVRHMENIEQDNFDGLIQVTGSNEISLIERKFNEMSVRLKGMIAQIEETNRLKRKAELRALQAQINPHFLYNTLDAVNWMAIDAGQFRIAEIVSSLGRFFRLSLSGGKDLISVEEEVKIAQEYAGLQRIRNDDTIRTEFSVAKECRGYLCAKLLIQPMIENAIKHGKLADASAVLVIRVDISMCGEDRLRLTVADNGKGLRQTGAPAAQGMRSGYGLQNVKQRMVMYFGEDVLFCLRDNESGEGAQVIVEWTCIEGEARTDISDSR